MELNGDGHLDILSGSYSRHEAEMAGLFQVLHGSKDGWKKPVALNGSDGQPLILPMGSGEGDIIDRICTRPFAVDLDGDGKLDIVSGNFRGTFAWFRGEGGGKFAPVATWLEVDGDKLSVGMHGDPFFVDYDKDGDFDLFSGSAEGGVFWFQNVGSKTAPKWKKGVTLLEAAGHGAHGADAIQFGDAHCKVPSADTRVWVDDVDGDGKLDLLVGDQVRLMHAAKGVDEKDARSKYAAWSKQQQEFFKKPQPEDEAGQKAWQTEYEALDKAKEAFLIEEATGFVWLLRGK